MTDEERLSFIAKNLRQASVHIAIRTERNIIQMWTHESRWIEQSVPNPDKFDLDDLRIIIDEAMTQAEHK